METDLKKWVADRLVSLLGYSQATVVQYVISVSKKATSPSEIVSHLQQGVEVPPATVLAFAHDIFARVEHKSILNIYKEQEKEAALLVRKQNSYSILEDDESVPAADSRKKRFRKKRENRDDEDEEERRRVKSRILRKDDDDDNDVDLEEKDRIRDLKERDELVQHMRERDVLHRRKLTKPMPSKRRSTSSDVQTLRIISRQKYLKERETKALDQTIDRIKDELNMFRDIKLTESEERQLSYDKMIYELAKNRLSDYDDVKEYRIPNADDLASGADKENTFFVTKEHHRDTNDAKQDTWEDYQMRKGTIQYGSKDRKQPSDAYKILFGNQIKFIQDNIMGGEQFKQESSKKREKSLAISSFEKLLEDRKSLPVYPYRESLLQAIEKHQVIVIVGETGSGKTTQIPQYLHEAGYTKRGRIACTQPRRVAAISVATRVAQEMGVKLRNEVGYSIRFEDCTSDRTVITYMTDGMLLREFLGEPDLSSYSVIMVDEAHERTVSTDILFGLVKDVARFRPDLKLLISSATLDAQKFSDYFDNAPIFRIPGRRFPVDISYLDNPVADYQDAAIVTALRIHVTELPGDGDILVFLTGQEEIEAAEENIKERIKGLGSKISELIICPIYANLPTDLQAKIFEPTPKGARKVVLATNIAEISLTIEGIKYVIDPGFCKMKSYNPRTGMESLLVNPISKASARQRAGRSGRTGPGKCFRLYTKSYFEEKMEDNTLPEIQRSNLANVVLNLKSLGITDLLRFDFMDPPAAEALLKALELLYALSALNKDGELTKVGRRMAEFPLDPMLSKMIVASEKYKCSEEIITIAAMLSIGNSVFYRPKAKQVHADNARRNFSNGNVGDHIALLNVYNSWKETNFSSQWCYENFIQERSLKRARDVRDQLEGLLDRVEIELTSNLNDLDGIRKVIASGYFPHTARIQNSGAYKTIKYPQTVHIHPSSSLRQERFPRWVLYHELVLTTKEYMRQVSELKPEWLVEIAPHYYQLKDVQDEQTMKMSSEGHASSYL